MRNQRLRLAAHTVCSLVASACLLIVMANTIPARQSRAPEGPKDLKREQRDREVREANLRTIETRVAIDKRDQKRIEAAIEQVKQDFRQIQIIRNELVRTLLAEKPLDFKLISDRAGEINKRADRLKTYLMPPVSEVKEKNQKDQTELNNEEIKGALVRLCNQIASFIENPVLKTPGINDVEQSAKAGNELVTIIQLSDNIKKSAEKITKATR